MSGSIASLSDSPREESSRKRVGKACDRCRLKKSKCDGNTACNRCRLDNAICVYGESKQLYDKIYPRGYVEMLEEQQAQLVSGLQKSYHRLVSVNGWQSEPLNQVSGQPLTHDILVALNVLSIDTDPVDTFEDDPSQMQQRLVSQGAPLTRRRRVAPATQQSPEFYNKRKRSKVETASSLSEGEDEEHETSVAAVSDRLSPARGTSTIPTRTTTRDASFDEPSRVSAMNGYFSMADQDIIDPAWQWQDLSAAGAQWPESAVTSAGQTESYHHTIQIGSNNIAFDSQQWPDVSCQRFVNPMLTTTYPSGFASNFLQDDMQQRSTRETISRHEHDKDNGRRTLR